MRTFFLHSFFWIVFFLMWNRVVYFYVSNDLNRFYFSALDVSLIIFGFYIIYLYIIPDYLRRKSKGKLILLSVLITVLLAGISAWAMGIFLHHMLVPIKFDFSWTYTDLQYNRFFIALLGVLAGCFVKLAMDRFEVGRRMEVWEKEKSQAELTYLKAQLNPHFLFNSLNSLYAQLELNPESAKGTLVSIAELLRYQLYECNTDFIPVAKEFAYLKNYFNLQSIRNDNCSATILIEGKYENLLIAPLLLIPFVENAFKYVSDFDNQKNIIEVGINVNNSKLQFYCINSVDTISRSNGGNMNKGIGVMNVRKRLELIYGNNYQLREEISNDRYIINLTLNLRNA
jgi:two-component system LytT family sensor kinase